MAPCVPPPACAPASPAQAGARPLLSAISPFALLGGITSPPFPFRCFGIECRDRFAPPPGPRTVTDLAALSRSSNEVCPWYGLHVFFLSFRGTPSGSTSLPSHRYAPLSASLSAFAFEPFFSVFFFHSSLTPLLFPPSATRGSPRGHRFNPGAFLPRPLLLLFVAALPPSVPYSPFGM